MVEFIDQERQRCRKCRGKLPVPTSNDRSAFCCRGCYEQYYRKRCRVCEHAIEQPKAGGQRALCKRPKCKSAWKDKQPFGRFAVPKTTKQGVGTLAAESISEVVAAQQVLKPPKAAGRIIAGPRLSADAFHAATGADNGEWQRAEARNKAALEERFKQQQPTAAEVAKRKRTEIQREKEYVALAKARDGWRYGDPIVEAYRENPRIKELLSSTGPDGLDIPEFLRRSA